MCGCTAHTSTPISATASSRWRRRAPAACCFLLDTNFFVSTFGEDVNGEIYVADYNGGTIYRITDTAPVNERRRAARH
jgi:hypothetical protein